jgi:nucleotide-binding universal stress UspA family protein
VATQDRVDVGCARCRQSAAIWNREMRAIAEEDLAEAAAVLRPSSSVDFVVEPGRAPDAIAHAARRLGADVIVVPWQPSRRLRRRISASLVDQLRRDGRWEVVIAPATAVANRVDSLTVHAPEPDPAA